MTSLEKPSGWFQPGQRVDVRNRMIELELKMSDRENPIICRIGFETIAALTGADPNNPEEIFNMFQRSRYEIIEPAFETKLKLGRFERDGSILLESTDL